ncbi:MAG: hypothetical protein HDT40_02655 [Lachnospiraceae bacterium]|nr:hypothetical protein [Lachnospiraceae bacterium]
MKDKYMMKITSLAVVTALITSTVGAISFAAGVNSVKSTTSTAAEAPAITDNVMSATSTDAVTSIIDEQFTVGKEETVYVLASADGTVNKIIVSDWLKNPNHSQSIEDVSELDNIENVKGDESYTINADNMKIWDAQGNDIYYQGTTNKALPVDVSISYKLDGKTISAENLAGKNGKLTIRFDYKNNESQTVEIDGKKQEMYVPFVMVTGMIVDDTKFSNITVSNGKVINDGDRCVIMGLAFPGMQENLGLDKSKLELPDYVEITADVKDFSLTTTVTLATNDVFNSLDLDNVTTMEQLKDSLDTLSSSSMQLVDGSSALYEGLATLLEKSETLVSGINDLYTGAGTLNSGVTVLSTGTTQLSAGTSQLDTGIIALNDGLKTLNDNSQMMRDGAEQVFNSLLAMADSQLEAAGLSVPKLTIENYKEILNGVIGSLNRDTVYSMAYNTALSQVTDVVNAQRPTIRAEVEKAVRRSVLEAVLAQAMPGTSVDDYMAAVAGGLIDDGTIAAVDQAVEAQMATAEIQATIDANTEAKVQSLIAENMNSSDVTTKIEAAVSQAESGAGSVQALMAQLDSYKTFYDGVLAYTSGVDTAYAGSEKLVEGSAQVKEGATSLSIGASSLQTGAEILYGGLGTLKEGSSALISGETELFSGSSKLADGMKEFNEKGIQKLVEAVDGDIDVLITRIKAMIDVSKDYQTFGGKSDDVNGTVKFIYRTDSIE